MPSISPYDVTAYHADSVESDIIMQYHHVISYTAQYGSSNISGRALCDKNITSSTIYQAISVSVLATMRLWPPVSSANPLGVSSLFCLLAENHWYCHEHARNLQNYWLKRPKYITARNKRDIAKLRSASASSLTKMNILSSQTSARLERGRCLMAGDRKS